MRTFYLSRARVGEAARVKERAEAGEQEVQEGETNGRQTTFYDWRPAEPISRADTSTANVDSR